jgi:hypothetical protein
MRPSEIDKGGVGVFAVTNIKKGTKVADGIKPDDFKHLIKWEHFPHLSKDVKKKLGIFVLEHPRDLYHRRTLTLINYQLNGTSTIPAMEIWVLMEMVIS